MDPEKTLTLIDYLESQLKDLNLLRSRILARISYGDTQIINSIIAKAQKLQNEIKTTNSNFTVHHFID